MGKPFRPFEGSATAWHSDPFFRARIKLTAWYVGFIVLILASFSGALFTSFNANVRRKPVHIDQELSREEIRNQFADDAASSLLLSLLIIDGIIFVVSAAASYTFAGYTLRPLQKTMAAQKRFVANASHELRTPLAVMQTDIEVLTRQDQTLSEQAKRTLASAMQELKVMKDLSNQMLSLSKAENSIISSNKTEFDLAVLLEEVYSRMKPLAEKKKIEMQIESTRVSIIHADQNHIDHVISNLIDNAIKYTKIGGKIMISLTKDKNNAVLQFKDTGIGISEKDLPHIFESFYKSDQSHSSEGAGLGLSIVKTLVTNNGGEIVLESKVGEGTNLTVKFLLL
ncbi:MAG: histidine kinase [Candidatus Doudnabacteria bacterium]|nr:histidine kinase [Candidatus Doudnabacteria bacterium]